MLCIDFTEPDKTLKEVDWGMPLCCLHPLRCLSFQSGLGFHVDVAVAVLCCVVLRYAVVVGVSILWWSQRFVGVFQFTIYCGERFSIDRFTRFGLGCGKGYCCAGLFRWHFCVWYVVCVCV